jgi:hypothetical protein
MRYNQQNTYEGGLKMGLKSPIIRDTELDEITKAVDICDRGLLCSQSCDSRHTCRRSTAAAVQPNDPLGKLVLFEVRGVICFLWAGENVPVFLLMV